MRLSHNLDAITGIVTALIAAQWGRQQVAYFTGALAGFFFKIVEPCNIAHARIKQRAGKLQLMRKLVLIYIRRKAIVVDTATHTHGRTDSRRTGRRRDRKAEQRIVVQPVAITACTSGQYCWRRIVELALGHDIFDFQLVAHAPAQGQLVAGNFIFRFHQRNGGEDFVRAFAA